MNRLLEEISFNPRHKNNRIIEEKNKIEAIFSDVDFLRLNYKTATNQTSSIIDKIT